MIRHFKSYKDHPLLRVSSRAGMENDSECSSEDTLQGQLEPARTLRRRLGALIYPVKNRIERQAMERRLGNLGIMSERFSVPDVICNGHKGCGNDIFLKQLSKYLERVDLFYYVDRQQTRDIVGLQ